MGDPRSLRDQKVVRQQDSNLRPPGHKGRRADVRGRPQRVISRLKRQNKVWSRSADVRPCTARSPSRLLSLGRSANRPRVLRFWESDSGS